MNIPTVSHPSCDIFISSTPQPVSSNRQAVYVLPGYTVPPKCKLTLDSRFSRESRIEDRVSILDSILDTRFSQKLSTRNFPDYADSMQVARKRFISCEERTITTMHDCRSTYNPSRANVLTPARAWRKSSHWKLRFWFPYLQNIESFVFDQIRDNGSSERTKENFKPVEIYIFSERIDHERHVKIPARQLVVHKHCRVTCINSVKHPGRAARNYKLKATLSYI